MVGPGLFNPIPISRVAKFKVGISRFGSGNLGIVAGEFGFFKLKEATQKVSRKAWGNF